MKIVAGLGNPGAKYDGTRHNVGFETLERLADRFGPLARRRAFQGESGQLRIGDEAVLLLWPWTYMNLSGRSVGEAAAFYKIDRSDLLVVCDDIHLSLGALRMRTKGSAGGQKGLADVVRRMGGEDVPRLRIGVDAPPERWNKADYVLSKFSAGEQATIDDAVGRAADAVEVWVREGAEACMNRYNAAAG